MADLVDDVHSERRGDFQDHPCSPWNQWYTLTHGTADSTTLIQVSSNIPYHVTAENHSPPINACTILWQEYITKTFRVAVHKRLQTQQQQQQSFKMLAIFNARPHTTVTVSMHWFGYIMDCKYTALVCSLLLRKQNLEKRKKFWAHPINSQRLLKDKFYSMHEDHKSFLDI